MATGVNRTSIKHLHTQLGRKGKLPWQSKRFKRKLPYIDATNLILMPVAHMLQHGLEKDLFVVALQGQHIEKHPVIFSKEQREQVKVCSAQQLCMS